MLELYQTPLKETPVLLSENKMNKIIELVDEILGEIREDKIRLLQSNIDKIVYQIYGLNDLEIEWIEEFLL